MTIATLIAAALQAVSPAQGPASMLDLLEGEWICRQEVLADGPVWRSETWRTQEDGRLVGIVHTVMRRAGSEDIRQEAELVISRRGRTPRLTYRVADRRPVHYRLVRDARQEAVFESVGSGSPRIISFRDSGFRRLEIMYGLENGSSQRWSYQPRAMHTAIIPCDGRRR
jgi:hypothetical protein